MIGRSNQRRSEGEVRIPPAVKDLDGNLGEFSLGRLTEIVFSAAREYGGQDRELAEECARGIADGLYEEFGHHTITIGQVNEAVFNYLRDSGHEGTAWAARLRAKRREKARENVGIVGGSSGNNATDKFLTVGSLSRENSSDWDPKRIMASLINEAEVGYEIARSVAEEVETDIFGADVPHITTSLIREAAHTQLMKRGLNDAAKLYRNFGLPRADLEDLIFQKITENSNIDGNNPEAINFAVAGGTLKAYALSNVFSEDVAKAHSDGMIHLHDLDMPTRVYCSAHSMEYIKMYGLKNQASTSGVPKHSGTLIGQLNTSLAKLQAFYAGALGVGDVNVFMAPHLQKDLEAEARTRIGVLREENERLSRRIGGLKEEGKDSSQLEKMLDENLERENEYSHDPLSFLPEEEIDAYLGQAAQKLIFRASQNAFSRGGQTLFLDFNIHAGVPAHERDTPAVLDGEYLLRTQNGEVVHLEKKKLEERVRSGYNLMELVDPRTGNVVLRERIEMIGKKEHLVQEHLTEEGDKVVTYGDYEPMAMRFTKALLRKFGEGDEKGAPFAFPKCDFHVNEEMFKDKKYSGVLDLACEIASKNGSPYFVFDRDAVTMSACCRLRTTIEDDYVLKHPEAMRFCGFQNVTINLPQAAYRATRNGESTLEGLLGEVDKAMDLAVEAHLQKKEFVEKLRQPGGPQYAMARPSADGQPYIDLENATYILGLIGLNEAMEHLKGLPLHEMDGETFKELPLKLIAHMNVRAREHGEKHGLKFSLEETPAESTARRLSLIDRVYFPESEEVIKGNKEVGDTYYTNSVHLQADAPVDFITRIQKQGIFHSAIDSGAITHAHVGEQRPSAKSIRKLVEHTFDKTQTAQLTISPEFTVCEDCSTTTPRLTETCENCDSENVYQMTRIVGYYSKINNWNRSKLAELEDRHAGMYAVGPQTPVEMPSLRSGDNGNYVAHRFGKPGCQPCADLGKRVDSAKAHFEKQGINVDHEYHDVHTEEGMRDLMVAGVNPSRLPALVIMNGDGVLYKGSTNYHGDGKADLITSRPIRDVIKKHHAEHKAVQSQ